MSKRPAGGVALLLATALAACSAGSGSGSGVPDGASRAVVIGLAAEMASLDFTTTSGAAIPQALLTNVYENLVTVDQDGEIVPQLATGWQVSEDGKTYTFDLAKDVTFSNGAAFTAQDVVFSIERVKSDWTTSLADAMDVVATATAVDDTTVAVTLSRPSNGWLYQMTTRIGAMFDTQGVADLATDPIGTGPYTVSQWKKGDSLTLQVRGDYWAEQPYFTTAVLRYFKDGTALSNAMLTGTVDIVGTVQSPEALAQFQGKPDVQIIEGTTNGEVVLAMNNRKAPLNDKRVRQAVRHAIDHRALVDTCWAGYGTLIGSMVPPTDPWYEDLTSVAPFDPAKARQLLKQAGQSNPVLRLRVPNLPYAVSCGQVVKSQLDDAGFRVKLDQLEFPAAWLSTVFTNKDYDLSIVAHVEPRDLPAVFGDPDYYLNYRNPAVSAAIAAADQGTPEEQLTNMRQAARLISADAAADWLFLLPNLMVADADIKGLPTNAVGESFDVTVLRRE